MNPYEYSLIQMSAGTRVTMFNERLDHAVQEGWEPILMSGDTTVTVLMRRPREGAAPGRQPHATAAAAVARPVAPAVQESVVAPQQVATAAVGGALNQQ